MTERHGGAEAKAACFPDYIGETFGLVLSSVGTQKSLRERMNGHKHSQKPLGLSTLILCLLSRFHPHGALYPILALYDTPSPSQHPKMKGPKNVPQFLPGTRTPRPETR